MMMTTTDDNATLNERETNPFQDKDVVTERPRKNDKIRTGRRGAVAHRGEPTRAAVRC